MDIRTDISGYILLRHSTNPSNCFIVRWNYCTLYIATTNSISNVSFNLKLRFILRAIEHATSHKNLVADDLRATEGILGEYSIFHTQFYKKSTSLLYNYYDTIVIIIICMYIACTIIYHWLFIWQNSLPLMAIKP